MRSQGPPRVSRKVGGSEDAGTYVAPFPGIHGWFWENRRAETITVTLRIAGFATGATQFKDGDAARSAFPRMATPARVN